MKPDMDIALSMFENLKEVKKMLGNGSSDDLASSAGIVRTASAPTKRSKISKALNHLNQAAELYEAVGDTRRAYFVTKLMTRVASELDEMDFGDETLPETVRFDEYKEPPSEDEEEWHDFLKRDDDRLHSDKMLSNLMGLTYKSEPDHKIRISPETWKAFHEMTPEERDEFFSDKYVQDNYRSDAKFPFEYTHDEERVDLDPDQISVEDLAAPMHQDEDN
jgi:hypothetical protein